MTELGAKGKYCGSSVMTHELKEKQQQFIYFNTRNLQMQNNVLWVKIVVSIFCRFSVASLWLVTVDDSYPLHPLALQRVLCQRGLCLFYLVSSCKNLPCKAEAAKWRCILNKGSIHTKMYSVRLKKNDLFILKTAWMVIWLIMNLRGFLQ